MVSCDFAPVTPRVVFEMSAPPAVDVEVADDLPLIALHESNHHFSGIHSTSVLSLVSLVDAPVRTVATSSLPCGVWHTVQSRFMNGEWTVFLEKSGIFSVWHCRQPMLREMNCA